jgi:hypothetical protein
MGTALTTVRTPAPVAASHRRPTWVRPYPRAWPGGGRSLPICLQPHACLLALASPCTDCHLAQPSTATATTSCCHPTLPRGPPQHLVPPAPFSSSRHWLSKPSSLCRRLLPRAPPSPAISSRPLAKPALSRASPTSVEPLWREELLR